MYRPRLIHVTSPDELRAVRPAWDDLWWRSDLTRPSVRAELLALWVEQFAPLARFHALVVEDQGQWVAGLPLVGTRLGRVLNAGGMPSNGWCPSGELLLDTAADVETVLDVLTSGMGQLPWQLLWLDEVVLDSPRWNALAAALKRAKMPVDRRTEFQVGWLPLDQDWEACRQGWSANHRQKMARSGRRLVEAGVVQLEIRADLQPDEVERWMQQGFEVEDHSWKGPAGTSVLRAPGMFRFFLQQAQLLASYHQLELAFLECGGRPIAFEYCWNAKGVCHMVKTGYDPQYAAYTPGQLLRYYLLERLYAGPERRAYDFMGPMTGAFAKWRPATYTVGRVAIAPRLVGRTLLRAYRRWWPLVRRLKGVKRPPDAPGSQPEQPDPAPEEEPVVASA